MDVGHCSHSNNRLFNHKGKLVRSLHCSRNSLFVLVFLCIVPCNFVLYGKDFIGKTKQNNLTIIPQRNQTKDLQSRLITKEV